MLRALSSDQLSSQLQCRRSLANPKISRSKLHRSTSLIVRSEYDKNVRLRSEVEAPFRLARLVIYGATCAGGFLGLLINTSQIIGASLSRPGSPTLTEAITNVGIDVVGVSIFGFLLYRDLKARDKQLKRLAREASLGKLRFTTTNNKILSVEDLRGVARIVILAGDQTQIEANITAAEEYRPKLTDSGVFIIQVPLRGPSSTSAEDPNPEDLRWKGKAAYLNEWSQWFEEQMMEAGANLDDGLYVGLRMDGRVRASGTGSPPWFRFANELPPLEGIWKGFGDGFDGPVY